MIDISKKTLDMIDNSIKNLKDAKPVDLNKISKLLQNHVHDFDEFNTCIYCYMTREELFIQASGEHPTEDNYE